VIPAVTRKKSASGMDLSFTENGGLRQNAGNFETRTYQIFFKKNLNFE
jgi:hypothetical protein